MKNQAIFSQSERTDRLDHPPPVRFRLLFKDSPLPPPRRTYFMNEPFVNNIIIDVSYNLNKYIQFKHVFEVVCSYTIMALYHLDRNEKLLEIFACPSNIRVFYEQEIFL